MAGLDCPTTVDALPTPALIVEREALTHNLDAMSQALPGERLRPHVKAHKCTALAREQRERGHRGFTCATVREMEGMASAGLGDDLLLANETLDSERLGRLLRTDARVTVAVDSEPTIEATARAGRCEVLIDVDVGLPRCGCAVDQAGRLADLAHGHGLEVRGVMGYEGHCQDWDDLERRRDEVERVVEIEPVALFPADRLQVPFQRHTGIALGDARVLEDRQHVLDLAIRPVEDAPGDGGNVALRQAIAGHCRGEREETGCEGHD